MLAILKGLGVSDIVLCLLQYLILFLLDILVEHLLRLLHFLFVLSLICDLRPCLISLDFVVLPRPISTISHLGHSHISTSTSPNLALFILVRPLRRPSHLLRRVLLFLLF